MTHRDELPWVVMKFGGTSVSSAAKWSTIAEVASWRVDEGVKPLIVCSALSGVSDQLENLLQAATWGKHEPVIQGIRDQHESLANELAVPFTDLLEDHLGGLDRLANGISLVGEYSPRLQARVLATGELMATLLGAAYLEAQGLQVSWVDARAVLTSTNQRDASPRARVLSAQCTSEPDPELRAHFDQGDGVILTQGFIASDSNGETVLLGRGGSDTSAAYFAVRLEAQRLEIWTDVPGMFTADPRIVPSARLLKTLDYAEAQEIATTGSAILHARCIPTVRHHLIPIHIRSTLHPQQEGTVICALPDEGRPTVKAISAKCETVLVSMETLGMWQQVGFLAQAFQCFVKHGLSIDMVATSETTVTVSLDADANSLDDARLSGLLEDLGDICKAEVIAPCAAVSLVGRHIRAILHQLGPALEVFQEQQVHLVSQAASDLNITFVVEEASANRLVERLHALVVRPRAPSEAFGPTWEQLHGGPTAPGTVDLPWWRGKRDALLAILENRPSAFVYDLATVEAAIEQLQAMQAVDRVFYAMKANANARIVECIHRGGIGLECVSRAEVEHVLSLCPKIDRRDILFTPNFAPREEYAFALDLGVWITLDNLHPLLHWPELFRDRTILARIDPGHGRGHHEKVHTAGSQSKFGVPLAELEELRRLADAAGARIVGLHAHSGSGILSLGHWHNTGALLSHVAEWFPDVAALNLGGGLGVPERPDQSALDLQAIDESLAPLKAANPTLDLWLEPGRFLVAQCGVLLTKVTQVKGKGDVRYVGVNTGMNSLIRPALYGAYHRIVNLSRLDEAATDVVSVVGPICETGDRLGVDHLLPPTEEGDVLLIADTGAYGRTMSSHYNLREPAEEVVI
jgi:diaminopimelate decarboxylase/aspartate kinase